MGEIGFNDNLKEFIDLNQRNIKSYSSAHFDTSEFNEQYLGFLNQLIQALSLAKTNINTVIIREQHANNQHFARVRKIKVNIRLLRMLRKRRPLKKCN